MKLLFFSLASAVYMYYIRSTMESFGCLKSGLTLDLGIHGIHGLFYKKTESDLAMVLVILSSIQNLGHIW